MTTKHGLNRLSRALRELYYKLCDMDLHKRMNFYNRNTGTDKAPDISASLTKHTDKLAPDSKPTGPGATSTATARSSKIATKPDNAKLPNQQPGWLNKVVNSIIRPKKFTSKITPDPYMGDKLKDSTWSHIHTALLHARQGEANTAKLHADIANEALKEAAHYMSEEDHKVLCEEVAKAFKELEG
jgi:hypothetical protein